MGTPNFKIQWGNTHADHCEVSKGRKQLEEEFNQHLHNWPRWTGSSKSYGHVLNEWALHLNYLWGCIVEYDQGGDEDAECCECGQHQKEKVPIHHTHPGPEDHSPTPCAPGCEACDEEDCPQPDVARDLVIDLHCTGITRKKAHELIDSLYDFEEEDD